MSRAWFIPAKTDAELLAEAQAAKITEINAGYTSQAAPLVKEYPSLEQATWLAQESEARAYLAWHIDQQGDSPATPVLDSILAGRNGETGTESLYELCQAVRANADRFTEFQVLTGKRQRLAKKARESTTIAQVQEITW